MLYQLSYLPSSFMYVCDDNAGRFRCQQGVRTGCVRADLSQKKRSPWIEKISMCSQPWGRCLKFKRKAGCRRVMVGTLEASREMQPPRAVENGRIDSTIDIESHSPSLRLPLARLLQLVTILQSERFPNARGSRKPVRSAGARSTAI